MHKLAEELAKDLFDNLKSLADRIARKPPTFDPRWAKTIIEAFSLYTRTSSVNYFVAFGDSLREWEWPFPAYLDLDSEIKYSTRALRLDKWPRPFYPLLKLLKWRSMNRLLLDLSLMDTTKSIRKKWIDWFLSRRFCKASKEVFAFWRAHPLLQSKRQVILDLEKAYNAKLWGTCIPSILPLIDYLMRHFFQTDNLFVSVSTLVDAFRIAKLTPESLKPGYGVAFDITDEGLVPARGPRVADSVEKDLRLPGVYLTSFVDFAFRYYSWHTTASSIEEVNRHAVLHGDMNYWSKTQTTKVLMFFDLVVKLEPVLRIIVGTEETPSS